MVPDILGLKLLNYTHADMLWEHQSRVTGEQALYSQHSKAVILANKKRNHISECKLSLYESWTDRAKVLGAMSPYLT